MRLWSISPKFLDKYALMMCWRAASNAKKHIREELRVKDTSQMKRFLECRNPEAAINWYLYFLYQEALRRHYQYNPNIIDLSKLNNIPQIKISKGQVMYELTLIQDRVVERDPNQYDHNTYMINRNPSLEDKINADMFVMTQSEAKERWEESN